MSGIGQKLFIILITQIILSGCTNIAKDPAQTPVVLPPQVVAPNYLEALMQYYNFLYKKKKVELADEYENVKQDFLNDQNDENRIKYILLLSFPKTTFHNINTALLLLNEWPNKTQLSSNLIGLKNLLIMLLKEQQRLNGIINSVSQKLKAEQKRAIILQKKVDDIKDMEKNLLKRDAH